MRNIEFARRRKIWYILSLLIIIPGLVSFAIQGLNLGIDFKGGSIVQLQFQKPVSVTETNKVLAQFGLEKGSVVQKAGPKEVMIRTKALDEKQTKDLVNAFKTKFGQLDLKRSEKVGPVIGKELTSKALWALLVASVLMVIYITFRFEFKFGIAAIIALLHDVAVMIGVFSLLRIEVDSTFVAAVLTIIGYSINDTIVIFDRIRENLKMKKKEPVEDLVNRSINQTLARSINTVLTVIFTLVALLVFGGETTKTFALALLIGVTSGAYSSIFNASQLWIDFTNMAQKRKVAARAVKA